MLYEIESSTRKCVTLVEMPEDEEQEAFLREYFEEDNDDELDVELVLFAFWFRL
jgi:hypothetical protein